MFIYQITDLIVTLSGFNGTWLTKVYFSFMYAINEKLAI